MSSINPSQLTPAQLAKYIDHTQLRPEATDADIEKACAEAREYGFFTVCLYPKWLPKAVAWLEGSGVLPICVVGFPTGNEAASEKAAQTRSAIEQGAKEIDMVLNRTLLRKGADAEVLLDIQTVVEAANGVPVKVILENSELSPDEKRRACALAKKAGARFVKTSTGFSKSGATAQDIRLMRQMVGEDMGVKASGGIRSYETALQMIEAGADRLGTSASVEIVRGAAAKGEGY